jgi:anti-sigma B factor antagonist
MTCVSRDREVTIVEFGPSYDSLDDAALEETGGVLLGEAFHANPPCLLLDLSGTRFIGSRFIELLVQAWKRLRQRGGTLALCGVQPFCSEVLHTTKLDTLWTSFPTRSDGVSALAGP